MVQTAFANNEVFTDLEVAESIIQKNEALSATAGFSSWKELRHFLSFTGTMAWSFPVAQMMRWRIRRNPRLQKILQFKELLPVRNNIEKGSFAYDTLLFRENIFSLLSNKSHLANLVCLAILFGDEFIDGIARQYGKKETAILVFHSGLNYDLRHRINANGTEELYYEFDICTLLPQQVLTAINEKYGISYAEFYHHLLFLLDEMNRHLCKLPADIGKEAATLICKVCNLCFDTYKEDIASYHEHYSFNELCSYQKSKDEDIVMILLNLRAVLLGKRTLHYQKQFFSWSSMIRCMQLYDDMEDAAHDCDYQMNMCCWLARTFFEEEWGWLLQHKDGLKQMRGVELNGTIALHMPGSCMMVLQHAKHISMSQLNWVQQKINNYLWGKNWLGIKATTVTGSFDISKILPGAAPHDILAFLYDTVNRTQHYLLTTEMKKAWVVDVALMDGSLRKYISHHASFREWYMLSYHFLEWSTAKKAALLDRLCRM